ncbi:MAG: glycoside hydrolase family 18 protein [Chloroflexota bacterium]
MRLRFLCLTGLILVFLAAVPLSAQSQPKYHILGYYASWGIYDRGYYVTDIPADKLTHLTYAFAFISDAGEITLGDEWADTQFPYPNEKDDQPLKGNFHQLQLLKQAHPALQTLISIGGWSESGKFSDVALTDASRKKFAASVVAFMVKYGFDGADIDWEYPTGGGDSGNIERPEDKDNFPLFLAELRAQFDAQQAKDGHHYLLTIALGSDRSAFQPLDWAAITPSLDWINVMTYDMAGEWSAVTDFNAPLYAAGDSISDDIAIRGLLELGIPAEKLVMGAPFYGRGWGGVGATKNGLHQPYKNIPAGTSEAGSYDYYDIAANYIGKYPRFWDDTAQSPWLYDKASGLVITYDDPESITKKAEYVRSMGLGGMMFWELSQDTPNSALLTAMYDTLIGQ